MHRFMHGESCKVGKKYDEQCPACVVRGLAHEVKRLKASLREAASRNHGMRKKLRRSSDSYACADSVGYTH